MATQLLESIAAVVMRLDIIWLERYRIIVANQCLFITPQIVKRDASVVACFGVMGSQGDGLVKTNQSLSVPTQFQQGIAAIIMHLTIIWFECYRFVVAVERFLVPMQFL